VAAWHGHCRRHLKGGFADGLAIRLTARAIFAAVIGANV
jgi:hypothetical protein